MADYLRRDSVIDIMNEWTNECVMSDDHELYSIVVEKNMNILDLPIYTSRSGEWLHKSLDDQDEFAYVCSECKGEEFFYDESLLSRFCPNCGAEMAFNKKRRSANNESAHYNG